MAPVIMRSSLWGPPLWDAMFACAWGCADANIELLRVLLLEQLPALLPCPTCREHYRSHIPTVNRRARGRPRDAAHAVLWLWHLKDQVNRTLQRTSLHSSEVVDRLRLHGPVVDEIRLGDTLVLVAISARSNETDDLYVAMCHTLARLLPAPGDSALRQMLGHVERPIVATTLRAARVTRLQHNVPVRSLAHYRLMAAA